MIANLRPVRRRLDSLTRITRVKRIARLLLGLTALATTFFCFSPTLAMAKGKTVAVVVDGPDAEAVRGAIADAVPHGATVADAGTFKSALVEQGLKIPFGKTLDGGARDKTLARVRKAAAAVGVDGTLIALVTRTHKERHVRLLLVATPGPSGDLEDEVVQAAKPTKDDQEKLASSVGTALVDYRGAGGDSDKPQATTKAAPPADEASPGSSPDSGAPAQSEGQQQADTPSGPERAHGVVGHDLVEIALGAGAIRRQFGYSVVPSSSLNLRPYTVFPAGAASVQGEIYPLADSHIQVLRDIGLIGYYSRSLFLQSNVVNDANDTVSIGTTATSILGGLRWRTMLGGEGGTQLGISASYTLQSFSIDTTGTTAPTDLPSVNYQAIRPGADVRVPIGKLSLLAQAGFRACLSAGDVALRFRGTTTSGFDASIGAAYLITPGWEVRALADYEGYFYSFNPQASDAYRAQSAVDNNYGGRIALAAIF
jgi:hypothetical protein